MVTFRDLKKNRGSSLRKLSEEIDKISKRSYADKDDRLWYPNVGKEGNGFAVIRFLPPHESEDIPYVRLYTHGFQGGSGKWYIENCLSTIGQTDPVLTYNKKLWELGTKQAKDQVSRQKRRTNYYSNVLVIKDPANPENEGKVFIYRYGPVIWDILQEAMYPPAESGEKGIDPFQLWGKWNEKKDGPAPEDYGPGATFKVRIKTVDGQRKYTASKFDAPSALFEDEDGNPDEAAMEGILSKCYKLQDFVSADKFKPAAVLEARMNEVLGLNVEDKVTEDEDDVIGEDAPVESPTKAPKVAKAKKKDEDEEETVDEDAFFKSLGGDAEDDPF